ncbi:MAG: hypothetical protein WBM02_11960 [bacterium]
MARVSSPADAVPLESVGDEFIGVLPVPGAGYFGSARMFSSVSTHQAITGMELAMLQAIDWKSVRKRPR